MEPRGSKPGKPSISSERLRGSLRVHILRLYGEDLSRKTRRLEKLRKKKAKLLSSLAFLERCRDSDTLPSFVIVRHHIQSEKAKRILHRASSALLRERIQHTRGVLDRCSLELYHLHLELAFFLHQDDWNTVERITFESSTTTFVATRSKQIYKYDNLHSKQHQKLNEGPEKDRHVINLTDNDLDGETISLLAKGLNFAIAPTRVPKEEIATGVEAAVRSLHKMEADDIREDVSRILLRARPPKPNVDRKEKEALRRLRQNNDLLILSADKGNATVVMDKDDYDNKITELLDMKTYSELKSDPTAKLQRETKWLIEHSSIPEEDRRWLVIPAPKPPRLYGLPKVHKEGVPLRPIVSAIDSPTHKLARYLARALSPYSGNTSTFVKNSTHFIDLIKNVRVSKDDLLVSLDVESLFTNIPIDGAVNTIKELTKKGLPKDFTKMAEFCLQNSYFQWNGKFYKQLEGTAMGSPLSPVVANLFMEDFEREALASCPKQPKLFVRYVDDTFIIWQHGEGELINFLNHMNSQKPSIRFTMEVEKNNCLPFLDVLVSKNSDGTLRHSVFRKSTHTDRYLHAESHHHPQQKASAIKTLFHRARVVSDKDSFDRERSHLFRSFQKNGYRPEVIRKIAKEREDAQDLTRTTLRKPKPAAFAVIPYVAGTSEKISRVLAKHNVVTRFTCVQKTANLLCKAKDRLPEGINEGVYQVMCQCGKSYIGQTSRALQCRLREHQRDVKNMQTRKSALAEHTWSGPTHNMKFEEAKLIVKENRYFPRIIREAIEIVKTPTNINREDGYHISNTWKRVFMKDKKEGANDSAPG
jgi:hypothetical protein